MEGRSEGTAGFSAQKWVANHQADLLSEGSEVVRADRSASRELQKHEAGCPTFSAREEVPREHAAVFLPLSRRSSALPGCLPGKESNFTRFSSNTLDCS